MPLYHLDSRDRSRSWITELDASDLTLGENLVFERGEDFTPTPAVKKRIERVWKEKKAEAEVARKTLFNGPLVYFNGIQPESDTTAIRLGKTDYRQHHGTTPVNGIDDTWTAQHRPYRYRKVSDRALRAIVPNGNELATAFAVSTLIRTSDRQFLYGVRTNNVDCYTNSWSFPSGGRISGDPSLFVDEVTADSSTFEDHVKRMLSLEFPGVASLSARVQDVRVTAIIRSIHDLDITRTTYAEIDVTAEQMRQGIHSGKYSQGASVTADAAGIAHLLDNHTRFPATVSPTFICMAESYGVDPTEMIPELERI